MTSTSKYVYIDKLDDTVKKYNNTYLRTIKMKPAVVKDNIQLTQWNCILVEKLII